MTDYCVQIAFAMHGIMDTLAIEDECGMAWGLIEYSQSDFNKMYDYMYERIGDLTSDSGVVYNMIWSGIPVYVYDCESMNRTELTYHNLDVAVQAYLKLEPDFLHWMLDDYDTILQYALYGTLMHI